MSEEPTMDTLKAGIDVLIASNKTIVTNGNLILSGNKAFEDRLIVRLDNIDKDISVLYDSRNEQQKLISKLEASIEILKELRVENREDLKLANDRADDLREEIMAHVNLAMTTKNEACKEIHKKLESDLDFQIIETQQSFGEKFSSIRKWAEEAIKGGGLAHTNKILNLKVYLLMGGMSLAVSTITFFITKYVVK
jgi:restriction endonuclease Mrr